MQDEIVIGNLNLRLRPAMDADIPFLRTLRILTMHGYFKAVGVVPNDKDDMNRILNAFSHARIVESEGVNIGLFKVVPEKTCIELYQIQLLPAYQNRGIATVLLTQLIEQANDSQRCIRLSVLHKNPAKNLYARLGFKVDVVSDHSYEMLYIPDIIPMTC